MIKRHIFVYLFILGTSTMGLAQNQPVDESSKVAAVFPKYVAALKARDGASAALVVDAATIAWYAELRAKALYAKRNELGDVFVDKLSVLMIRARVEKTVLEKMRATELLSHSVSQGWVGETQGLAVEKLAINDSSAFGYATIFGKPTPLKVYFQKEKGDWRLALRELSHASNDALLSEAKKAGLHEDQYAEKLLVALNLKVRWEPLIAEKSWMENCDECHFGGGFGFGTQDFGPAGSGTGWSNSDQAKSKKRRLQITNVTSDIEEGIVARYLYRNSGRYEKCFEVKNVALAALTVKFAMAEGRISDVQVSARDKVLAKCLQAELMQLSIPRTGKVSATLSFTPAN